jgi:hypothetical protein
MIGDFVIPFWLVGVHYENDGKVRCDLQIGQSHPVCEYLPMFATEIDADDFAGKKHLDKQSIVEAQNKTAALKLLRDVEAGGVNWIGQMKVPEGRPFRGLATISEVIDAIKALPK